MRVNSVRCHRYLLLSIALPLGACSGESPERFVDIIAEARDDLSPHPRVLEFRAFGASADSATEVRRIEVASRLRAEERLGVRLVPESGAARIYGLVAAAKSARGRWLGEQRIFGTYPESGGEMEVIGFTASCVGVFCLETERCESGICVGACLDRNDERCNERPARLYVDALAGDDASMTCSIREPCRSVSRALEVRSFDEAVVEVHGRSGSAFYSGFSIEEPAAVTVRAWPGTGTPILRELGELAVVRIDAEGGEFVLAGVTIEGGSAGVEARLVDALRISGVVVRKVGPRGEAAAIQIENVGDVVVEDSLIFDHGGSGRGVASGIVVEGADAVHIARNTLDGSTRWHIDARGGDQLIRDNVIIGGENGILSNAALRTEIANNRICGAVRAGLRIEGSDDARVKYNSIADTASGVVIVDTNVAEIQGNVFSAVRGVALSAAAESTAGSANVVAPGAQILGIGSDAIVRETVSYDRALDREGCASAERVSIDGTDGPGAETSPDRLELASLSESVRIELEALELSGFVVTESSVASGGAWIEVVRDGSGLASGVFGGVSGRYDLRVVYFDENDGSSELTLSVRGGEISTWILDASLGSEFANAQTRTERIFPSVALSPGDTFTLSGRADGGEQLRLDSVEFVPVPEPEAELLRFEAEDMNLDGFEVQATGAASGEAWIAADGAPESRAQLVFSGARAIYDFSVIHFDENDGVGTLSVWLNGRELDAWVLDEQSGSPFANAMTRRVRTVPNLVLAPGDFVEIVGRAAGEEALRIDYVEFAPLGQGG